MFLLIDLPKKVIPEKYMAGGTHTDLDQKWKTKARV
jgi:hypothetical protein